MSKFYGQVFGAAKSVASRRGFQNIKATVQSYDGSVITSMRYGQDGQLIVDLEIAEGESKTYGKTMFSGTISELVKKLSA